MFGDRYHMLTSLAADLLGIDIGAPLSTMTDRVVRSTSTSHNTTFSSSHKQRTRTQRPSRRTRTVHRPTNDSCRVNKCRAGTAPTCSSSNCLNYYTSVLSLLCNKQIQTRGVVFGDRYHMLTSPSLADLLGIDIGPLSVTDRVVRSTSTSHKQRTRTQRPSPSRRTRTVHRPTNDSCPSPNK